MSTLSQSQKEKLVLSIYNCGLLNFGEFELVSGITSPMYMNLRNLLSHPVALKYVAKCYAQMAQDIDYSQYGAVPYGAIAITSALSLETDTPWLCARKEPKKHGMGKNIIGDFTAGQKILVIDDVVTTGGSKIESAEIFRNEQLIVTDFLVIFDYEKGAAPLLKNAGYTLYAMLTIREALQILRDAGKVDQETHVKVLTFLEN